MTVMTAYVPREQRLHRETVKQLAEYLQDTYEPETLKEIFNDSQVVDCLKREIDESEDVVNMLTDLSKSKNQFMLLALLDYICDPRLQRGDVRKTLQIKDSLLRLLKEEGLDYGDGRWWISPDPMEKLHGDDRYRNSYGEYNDVDYVKTGKRLIYKPNDNKVWKITFIKGKSKTSPYQFYVNDIVTGAKTVRADSPLKKIIELSENKNVEIRFLKSYKKSINESKNGALFKTFGLNPTTIVRRDENGNMQVSADVKIEIISYPKFQKLLKQK